MTRHTKTSDGNICYLKNDGSAFLRNKHCNYISIIVEYIDNNNSEDMKNKFKVQKKCLNSTQHKKLFYSAISHNSSVICLYFYAKIYVNHFSFQILLFFA